MKCKQENKAKQNKKGAAKKSASTHIKKKNKQDGEPMLENISRIVMIVGAIIVGLVALLTVILVVPKMVKDKEFSLLFKKKLKKKQEEDDDEE